MLDQLNAYASDEDARHARHPAVPRWVAQEIDRYITHGSTPGDFPEAVIANDLQKAVRFADRDSFIALRAIVEYLGELPPAAWGTRQRMIDYTRHVRYFTQAQGVER